MHGLTDEQAAHKPSASELSLATLLKHVIRTERRWVVVQVGQRELPGLWPITDGAADFQFEEGETLDGLLTDYAAAAKETQSIVNGVADLGEPLPVPKAVRDVSDVHPFSARWVLLHLIEETARHAGHADIIRESYDGKTAFDLFQATEGE